jgi:hypothetical protein
VREAKVFAGRKKEWMDGGWIDGWMDGWMVGWIVKLRKNENKSIGKTLLKTDSFEHFLQLQIQKICV